MNRTCKFFLTAVAALLTLTAGAQDKEDMFNPVNTSVTSQTIAPDARAAGMGDVGAATGTPPSIPSPSPGRVWPSITPRGCASW